jgi:hypothetical protein
VRVCWGHFQPMSYSRTAAGRNFDVSDDLSARYALSLPYQVRPGILMTAKYAEDGQVCETVLQRVYTPDQTDAIR